MDCVQDQFGGRCCCNCRWLAEDHSHPNTDGMSIMLQRGFVCMAPEFVVERNGKAVAQVFSGWSEHGICEMHDYRPAAPAEDAASGEAAE